MSKLRYTVTGNIYDDESFSPDDMENLRKEIGELCDSYGIYNLRVIAEDDYCIKINDKYRIK